MNILDFYKMNNSFNKYFGFSLPASKMVVAKCLKLIWNHSRIPSGTYLSPFQGVSHLYRCLRRALKPYFGLIFEFWIIFFIFCEWIILLNISDSLEWIFRILFWIEFGIESFFRPDSMKKWIFKMDRPGLNGWWELEAEYFINNMSTNSRIKIDWKRRKKGAFFPCHEQKNILSCFP